MMWQLILLNQLKINGINMVILKLSRFKAFYNETYKTVADAAKTACLEVESGNSVPVSIIENGNEIWKIGGIPDFNYDELFKLAGLERDEIDD